MASCGHPSLQSPPATGYDRDRTARTFLRIKAATRCFWAPRRTKAASFLATWIFLACAGDLALGDVWVLEPSAPGKAAHTSGLPVSSSSQARVDLSELATDPLAVSFELPDGVRVVASRYESLHRAGRGLTWRGWTVDANRVTVTLTLEGNSLVGRIEHDDAIFLLLPEIPFRSPARIVELSGDSLGECSAQRERDRVMSGGQASRRLATEQTNSEPADSADQITLLTLYSPEAREAAGGSSQIRAEIQSFVDVSNTGFINSGMSLRYTLVHQEEVARGDSGDSATDLAWLSTDPGVLSLRNQLGADLVGLIVETTESGNCGRGRLPVSAGQGSQAAAFQVSRRLCSLNQMTFTHEHGHNLGMGHDDDAGIFSYSRGHLANGAFRTLMARVTAPCASPCPRVAYFSNPDVLLDGTATGVTNVSENARTGDEIGPFVANYRWNLFVSLTSVESVPTTTAPGENLDLAFGVTSESTVNLILEAMLRPTGSEQYLIRDSGNDVLRAINAGSEIYTRSFAIPPGLSSGSYDLAGALWYDVDRDHRITTADQRVAFLERLGYIEVQLSVDVAPIDSSAGEPLDDGLFRISRSSTGDALTVNVIVAGSATNGGDYVAVASTATIETSQLSRDIAVDIVDDNHAEGNEVVSLSLQPGTGYRVGSQRSASIVITDDESPGGACAPVRTLSCGGSDFRSNGGGGSTDVIDTYVCNGLARGFLTGPEVGYELTAPQASLVTVTLQGLSADLDLFALRAPSSLCLGGNCFAVSEGVGTTPESLSFPIAANTPHYLVVDGFSSAISSYTLVVACEALPNAIFSDGFESGSLSAWGLSWPP